MKIKQLARKAIAKTGYYLAPISQEPWWRLARFIRTTGVDLVLDVGANKGQFADNLRMLSGYHGRILSFEPIPKAFDTLRGGRAGDDAWAGLLVALGAEDGMATLNVSENLESSSFLTVAPRSIAATEASRAVETIDVAVRRADAIEHTFLSDDATILLKLDCQGYETAVIEGAAGLMPRITLAYMEVSLVAMYEGEPLIEATMAMMRGLGFKPISIDFGYLDPGNHEQLQADVLFARA